MTSSPLPRKYLWWIQISSATCVLFGNMFFVRHVWKRNRHRDGGGTRTSQLTRSSSDTFFISLFLSMGASGWLSYAFLTDNYFLCVTAGTSLAAHVVCMMSMWFRPTSSRTERFSVIEASGSDSSLPQFPPPSSSSHPLPSL